MWINTNSSIGGSSIMAHPSVIFDQLYFSCRSSRSSKALDWMSDPTDDFWHHQYVLHRLMPNIRGVQTNMPTDPPGQSGWSDSRTGRPNTNDGLAAGRRPQNLRPGGRSTGLNMKTRKKPIWPYYTGKSRRFLSMGAFCRWF